jgi:hypothetical protein
MWAGCAVDARHCAWNSGAGMDAVCGCVAKLGGSTADTTSFVCMRSFA